VEEKSPRDASPITERVVIVGETLCGNDWLSATLKHHSIAVTRLATLSRDGAATISQSAIVILDGSTAGRNTSMAFVNRSTPIQRLRMLLVGWSLEAGLICRFIDAGVGDFLCMPCSTTEVVLRLRLRSMMANRVVTHEHVGNDKAPAPDPLTAILGEELSGVRLSERELLLYRLLGRHIGEPVSREDILREIWHRTEGNFESSNIVDVYVRYLRVKLSRAAPHLSIVTVRTVGYMMRHVGAPG
jgi:DNA-binding response OmpR family regulator